MDLLSTLLRLFRTYGYAIVFFGVMLENAGIPVPGETILLAAGFFAAQQHFTLPLVMLVSAAGAIIGDTLGYLAGRRLGRPFAERYGRYLWLTPQRLEASEQFFARHGNKTILIARFISGLRVFAAFIAGMSRMRWHIFFIYNATGAVLWVTVITLLGYYFGHSWKLIEHWLGRASLIIIGIVIVCFAFAALRNWRQSRA
jgi:undecaprenyl-diphosphatase